MVSIIVGVASVLVPSFVCFWAGYFAGLYAGRREITYIPFRDITCIPSRDKRI